MYGNMDETPWSYEYQLRNHKYEGLDPLLYTPTMVLPVELHAHYGIVLIKDARSIIIPTM